MVEADGEMMTVEAEVNAPLVSAQLVHFNIKQPSDNLFCEDDAHWLDLCLTPRLKNSRACYRDHWNPHRFERLGDVFLVPAGEVLHARGECGHQASLICLLKRDPLKQWFEDELEWTDRRLEASLNIVEPNVRGLLLRLSEEARHPGFASETLVELIAAQIAIELSRYCQAFTAGPATGGLAPWRLRLIDERLAELDTTPGLGELAHLCKISVRQLTRGFRVSRGVSIGDYVAQSRIERAKQLLKTDACVKSISHAMGFASPSSFSYAFRRATGETPRQFRQRAIRWDA